MAIAGKYLIMRDARNLLCLNIGKISTMNKKIAAVISVLVILVFIGYMIFDTVRPEGFAKNTDQTALKDSLADAWSVTGEIIIKEGSLNAVTVSSKGKIYVGGDSFISCYDQNHRLLWNTKTPYLLHPFQTGEIRSTLPQWK